MRASVLTLGGAAESLFVLTVFRLNTRFTNRPLEAGRMSSKDEKKGVSF